MVVIIGRTIGSDWIDVIVIDFYFVVVQDDFLNQCIDPVSYTHLGRKEELKRAFQPSGRVAPAQYSVSALQP